VQPSVRPDQQGEIAVAAIGARSGDIEDPLRVFEDVVHAQYLSAIATSFSRNRKGILRTLFAPGSSNSCMQFSGIKAGDPLRHAYRTTFDEYACKLEALQRLIDSNHADEAQIEAAIQEADAARRAHNAARDLLAAELVAQSSLKTSARRSPPAGEDRIRETAQLLWEFAGRPQGTAEGDWRRAEQLVLAASSPR
jgi:hypothetical protein